MTPATTPIRRFLSPPELAHRYGVDVKKILCWIRRGELPAVNLAADPHGRPRFRINESDIAVFEARRAVSPPPPKMRRRRIDPSVIQFF